MSYLQALDLPNDRTNLDSETHSVDAVSLEFEQLWDTTSDLNEDDLDYMREESAHGWGTDIDSWGTTEASVTPVSAPGSTHAP